MSNSPSRPRRRTQQFLRLGAVLLLCFLATDTALAAQADSRVTIRSASLQLDTEQDVYELEVKADISLPDDARKAIEAGLTLRFSYEIELSRVRHYMPDATVAALVQKFELSYHALSQRYLLRNLNTGEQEDFGTLQAALARLGDVHDLPVIDEALVPRGPSYEGYVRGVLDMSTAPDALKWMLFWTDDWSASSDWYTWPLRL
ncbi:MAG: DUF4390 domain-containing protein [Gammaproteobacteria bacterium]|nr:DUF4390 domain-containing protein [Gammaproteobacteria bacterium]